MNRREFIASATVANSLLTLPTGIFSAVAPPVFQQRGYYLCFMRMPTFGLTVWREILDDAAADGANTIILWMGGAFRSKKFPMTWQWAKAHETVKADSTRELIAHAHRRDLEVLLGFPPFGYDGVNQLPLEQPELKALGTIFPWTKFALCKQRSAVIFAALFPIHMNVVVENLPHCLATLKVEVEPERVTETWNAVASDFGKHAKIAGYRPGKVPRGIIEKKFRKEIRAEVEKKLLNDSTREAIQKHQLRVLGVQNVEDVLIGDDRKMSFTATVVTQPQFELPTYKGLAVAQKSSEVTEAEIDESIENLREQGADFIDVPERGAVMDDYIVVDYSGTIDGKPVHEVFPKAGKPLTANEDFWIRMTDEAFFPGYCANLVGAKREDVREFDIVVPQDFPVEGMPGVTIHYAVTLKGIKERVLPTLDDAFADTVIKGKTLAELRATAKEELSTQKSAGVDADKRSQIMRHLLGGVECELPQNLVRNETQRILSDIVKDNQARGVTDEVLKENQQQIVGAASQNARERLKGTFVLLRIAEKEGIKATREELLGRVAALAQKYEMTFEKMRKELEKRGGLDQINEEIITGKVLDFLMSNASITAA